MECVHLLHQLHFLAHHQRQTYSGLIFTREGGAKGYGFISA